MDRFEKELIRTHHYQYNHLRMSSQASKLVIKGHDEVLAVFVVCESVSSLIQENKHFHDFIQNQ
jgi:hypothetical protein